MVTAAKSSERVGDADRAAHEPSQSSLSRPSGEHPSRSCSYCVDEDGVRWLPMYGVAPHECFWRKGPQFTLGQSTLVPFSGADCFVPDLEPDEDWSAFVYPSACGVFYCPSCDGEHYRRAWQALVKRIGEPPASIGEHSHDRAQVSA